MKRTDLFLHRCLVLVVALCLAMMVPAAYAVVKNVSIVDNQGNSLANTTVTIVFPDGTEVEEESDDDGMLIYDFPGDGDYIVKYAGGQMAVNVSGGITTAQWIGAGAVAAVIVGVGIVASDSGTKDSPSDSTQSGSGNSSGSGSSGGSSTSPDPDPGGSFDPGTCTPAVYNVTTTVNSDPDGHNSFDSFDGPWEVTCPSSTQANITSQSGGGVSPPWTCNLDSSGNCNASPAICTYAGFTTSCALMSRFAASGWTGTMSAGADGQLPDTNSNGSNEPIVVDFVGIP